MKDSVQLLAKRAVGLPRGALGATAAVIFASYVGSSNTQLGGSDCRYPAATIAGSTGSHCRVLAATAAGTGNHCR